MQTELLRLQDIRQVEHLELLAKQVVEGFILGLHKSPFHGFSVEFAEHRIYNPGESTRYIDWKVFGRTDRLYSKKFEEETNLRCQLVIDTSSSMYFPEQPAPSGKFTMNKVVFSAVCAAAIIQMLRGQRMQPASPCSAMLCTCIPKPDQGMFTTSCCSVIWKNSWAKKAEITRPGQQIVCIASQNRYTAEAWWSSSQI